MKKSLLISVLFFLVISLSGTFVYFKSQGSVESATKKVKSFITKQIKSKSTSPAAQSPQKFIDNSAREVITKKPNDSGTPSQDSSLPTICTGKDAQNFNCYDDYYTNLVKDQSVKAAFDDLKKRYPTNQYVVAQCHPITHVIGQAAVEKYKDVAEGYTHGDSFCWSGYYHGFLEGYIAKLGSEKLENKMTTICSSLATKQRYGFDHYNCVHGLGHGVMAYTYDNLFDSLKLCDLLTDSWEQTSCYSGVFMENVMIDNKNHFTKYLKPSEPLYPCNAVENKYKMTCYLMQTSYMLKVTNNDFNKVFSLCSTVEATYRPTCYQSLGRDASGRSASNIPSTKTLCELGKDYEQRSNCVIGAVKDIISYFHSDVQAKQFCDVINPDTKDICLSTTKSYYSTF